VDAQYRGSGGVCQAIPRSRLNPRNSEP
jgi:hypothetical protein